MNSPASICVQRGCFFAKLSFIGIMKFVGHEGLSRAGLLKIIQTVLRVTTSQLCGVYIRPNRDLNANTDTHRLEGGRAAGGGGAAGHCRTALSDIKDKLIQTSHRSQFKEVSFFWQVTV